MENNPYQPIVLLPLLGLAFSVIAPFAGVQMYETLLLKGMFVLSLALFLHMAFGVINELCEYLKISAFTIPYPPIKSNMK